MNNVKTMTPNEIRKLGIEALAKALGPVGMVRFIQSFDKGSGDYTKERSQWLTDSVDEIAKKIGEQRTD